MRTLIRRLSYGVLRRIGLRGVIDWHQNRLLSAEFGEVEEYVARVAGREVHFGSSDPYSKRWFFPRYAHGRIHEPSVTFALVRALKDASCFADVGSNLGWFTCVAAKHLEEGRVFAFEMDEANIELLDGNIRRNGLKNVTVTHAAVSDAPGHLEYRKEATFSPTFTVASRGYDMDAPLVRVESIALDPFFAKQGQSPDVMKIDVEGAELAVLRGMSKLLASGLELFIEVHPQQLRELDSSAEEVLGFLIDRGYSVSEIPDLRGQDTTTELRPLPADARLVGNSMLYAAPSG